MVEIKDNKMCCGCEACIQICPKKCISLAKDNEGFYYPKADKDICINCGLCEKVCPYDENTFNQESPFENLYAYENNDKRIISESSSGGAFTAIATIVLESGGIVFGAAFDKDWSVHHICVDSTEALKKLRGSKYVQSHIGDTFIEAKKILISGRTVLFSGTPCQIRGLKQFLKKDFKNLLTVDFICHGVPNTDIWHRYLKEEIKNNSETYVTDKNVSGNFLSESKHAIADVSFRDKRNGWENYNLVITSNRSISKTNKSSILVSQIHRNNPYMKGFLADVYLRPSCYNCPAKKGTSGSDITMADFWGIKEVNKDFYSPNGISMLIVQNQKGLDFLTKLKGKTIAINEDIAILNRSYTFSSKPHPKRDEFFKRLRQEEFIPLVENITREKLSQRLYYMIRIFLKYIGINHQINKFLARWEQK